ncbi:DegV family protein [Conexibacter sp. SYSU D00693]|uniref:DegV family protein n=1 Tax=Conexibacter sp. SYSU D00693 TaxID=2812560 RepID=UPI00196BADAB|nr:DegV family protein [Conexibacter sp. SYSU D00693]
MSSRVAVVTDTTQYLPRELLREHDVATVSLYVNDGDRHERESEMPDFTAFYERLRTMDGALPTTSQPSIGDFLAVFEPLLAEGRDIVSVHLAGGISGTVESGRQAAAEAMERHPGRRVEVVDSRSACGGMGMIVLAGAAAAEGGADVDGVKARVEEALTHARIWFAVDTLEYLRRGGRIGTAQAWVGGALKIKPILTVDGEIVPIERVRTARRAFERMVDFATTLKEEQADCWAVQHIQAPDEAARLAERCQEVLGGPPIAVSEIGPVIGTHVGPGLLGVGGIPGRLVAELRR